MFGIGLPEMILILALALIVVGPDKLPDLARSVAKGLLDLKNTAEGLKESLKEEGNPLDAITPDLEEAAKSLKENLLDYPLDSSSDDQTESSLHQGVNPPPEEAAAYQELLKTSGSTDPAETPELNETDEMDQAPVTKEKDSGSSTTPSTEEASTNFVPPNKQPKE